MRLNYFNPDPDTMSSSGLRKNKSTPENRAFWESVESARSLVNDHVMRQLAANARATELLIKAAQILARGGHDKASVAFLIADLEAWIRRADK